MGILTDIALVVILLLSGFLGYKKGLVKLGARLFAGIIAIILTLIMYKPVSNIVINNTSLNEKIENAIIQNTTNFIEEKAEGTNVITNNIENQILPEQARNISQNVIYAITGIILFVLVKIILSIILSFVDSLAKLPILKQFNEIGGIIYGLIRGVVIVCVCILLMGVFIKMNPENEFKNNIEESYLTKRIYEYIVKF